MSKPKVYIETTIVGFLTARSSRDLVTQSKQQTTKEWWSEERSDFDLFCSPLVLREAGVGDSEAVRERLQRLDDIPALDLTEEARDLAEKLVGPGQIPPEYYEDALHIAVATVNGIDFLLTWNLTHIANATLRRAYEEAIRTEGYESPIICTPEELLNIETWQVIEPKRSVAAIPSSKKCARSERSTPESLITIQRRSSRI